VILVTTPTGRIGRRIVGHLLERDTPLRVIVRDPARLDPDVRNRVDVIVGTHDDPAVLDAGMQGVSGLFWLVPPNATVANTETHYVSFARVAAHAIRQHAVPRVVAVSSAGHAWPKPAGVLSGVTQASTWRVARPLTAGSRQCARVAASKCLLSNGVVTHC